ncbi:hypothetical protein F66182_7862 [Fusarium sp. NRRL 66182]|nr:hypothetical protein F66182_7862 [Fusarium sp. NRRL 66182]
MPRKSDKSHRHSHSRKSHQPQQEEIPIDPALISGTPYSAYTETQGDDYIQAGPSVYAAGPSTSEWQDTSQAMYYTMQQPATVNPSDVLLNPGYPYPAQGYSQNYPSSTYQAAGYAQLTRHSKHMKQHDKPIKCKADPSCTVKKAEQRDMDRHYQSSHKSYAASKGILTEEEPCGFEGCNSKFTRTDNRLKHWQKYHNYRPE